MNLIHTHLNSILFVGAIVMLECRAPHPVQRWVQIVVGCLFLLLFLYVTLRDDSPRNTAAGPDRTPEA